MYFLIQVLVIKQSVCFYNIEWILSLAPEPKSHLIDRTTKESKLFLLGLEMSRAE
jgi:hypothetical protein